MEDVHARKGHIACDASTSAEIVIPLRANGEVVGVLDLDSIGSSSILIGLCLPRLMLLAG